MLETILTIIRTVLINAKDLYQDIFIDKPAEIKSKRKSKRDAEMLALYRDWPPDLVDTYLAWEKHHRIGVQPPSGYWAWKYQRTYQIWLDNPHKEPGFTIVWK